MTGPVCILRWVFSWFHCVNLLSQMVHLNGFSPINKMSIKYYKWVLKNNQTQLRLIPVCLRTWSLRVAFLVNTLSQKTHVNCFVSILKFMAFFNLLKFMKIIITFNRLSYQLTALVPSLCDATSIFLILVRRWL